MSDPRVPAQPSVLKPPREAAPGKTHCPLCLGLFKTPRLLPCLHTVCTTCLEKLEPFSVGDARAGGSDASSEGSGLLDFGPRVGILCPVCDAQVDLPAGGVKALTIDHLALNDVMLESQSGDGPRLACDLCGDRGVEKRCQTCKANLCHFCCQAHRRQKKTAEHAVVELDEPGRRAGKPAPCPAHPAEELRLFCELCERPVCGACAAGEHRGHPCEDAGRAVHRHGDALRALLRGARPRLRALDEALARVRGRDTALRERVKAVAAEVRACSDGHIAAIQEHRDRLLRQLAALGARRERALRLQSAQLEQLRADVSAGVEFAEHLLASGSDLAVLVTKGVVVARLRALSQADCNARPAGHPHIRFCPQEKAGQCRGYQVYGALDAQEVDPARCILQGEDLHKAREKQTSSFTLLCKDAAGESLSRGGDHISVAVVPKDKKDSPVRTMVQDNKDGTYNVSYTPKEPGIYTVWVCVEEQHVQGSPFTVTVRRRHRTHSGVFHCCTFCSSGGQKAVRCACGGTMPGGYLGCGHGHKGHPGRPHWSCCGKFAEKSECTHGAGPGAPRNLLRTVAL
ncbi:tripartite motif-containing protein 45 [Perognathus longimembris pacificus]|uniref:tripartite motif-containing protein 45 n=1 Tax=Perognathus longimembris pacificus TaxID=214514 RepID=UPI002019D1E8|nr:tripartite motif-containing protein 45 [Perognathus longimembris pacificus]